MSLPTSANNSVKVRPSLLLSLLAIALGFSQLSCAAAATELSCGTGDKIVFGYQEPTLLYPGVVAVENGVACLFVDESCRYWATASSRQLTRTGTLTRDQLARLNRELMTRDWMAIRDAGPEPVAGVVDGLPSYVWRDDMVGQCGAGCPEVVSSAISAARSLTAHLWAAGSPLPAEAPMRWRADVDTGSVTAFPVEEWQGVAELGGVVEPTAGVGDAPLVSGADAALLRSRLESLYATYAGLPVVAFYTEGDIRYRVYARDALPFEDERGLVRPPGIDWGVE
jgi:hypothetical protein